MTLINPLGLIGLIGLIALIIIYILKPKYEDKTVASTYIWKLSLNYHRPKSPFDWLKGSILIILQILIIVILALLMAKPMFKSREDSGEKIVVLDGSASMQVLENNMTRFENAKSEIIKLANQTAPENRFTLIFLGEEIDYVVRRSNSLDYIRQHINALTPTNLSLNITSSDSLVESVMRENPEAKLYIFSNKDINTSSKVDLISYSNSNSWNVGIIGFYANLLPTGYYTFQVEIVNYGSNREVPIELRVDGEYRKSIIISLNDNDTQLISFDDIHVLNYKSAEITLDVNDDYSLDNKFIIFNKENQKIDVLMYSESEDINQSSLYFLSSALRSISNSINVKIAITKDELEDSGYDLYVYDTYSPDFLPNDGSVWFINPNELPSEIPFIVGPEISGQITLNGNASPSKAYQTIMKNINVNNIYVTKYKSITSYLNFESLASVNMDPIILVQEYNDQKIIVLPFDLSFSNLPITIEFPFLVNNMFNYSIVNTIKKNQFKTGETIEITPKIGANKISVLFEDQIQEYTEFPINYQFNNNGIYQIIQSFYDKPDEINSIYVHVPFEESFKVSPGGELILPHITATNENYTYNLTSLTPYILLALFGLILVEWMVQYREQY